MRSYKNFNPKGLSEFYCGLLSMNVPHGLIGNPEALHALETGNIPASRPPGIPAGRKGKTQLGQFRQVMAGKRERIAAVYQTKTCGWVQRGHKCLARTPG